MGITEALAGIKYLDISRHWCTEFWSAVYPLIIIYLLIKNSNDNEIIDCAQVEHYWTGFIIVIAQFEHELHCEIDNNPSNIY